LAAPAGDGQTRAERRPEDAHISSAQTLSLKHERPGAGFLLDSIQTEPDDPGFVRYPSGNSDLTTTLLAVDDSKTMRKVIEITFSGEDFRLITCASADDAMSKLSERPAVALIDAGLDGTSGYELCKRLKAAQPGLGVVILSNKQQPFDKALGGQVGADDFADKPFDTQQLIDKVNALTKKLGVGAGTPAPAAVAVAPAPVPRAGATTLQYGASPVAAPAAAASAPPVAPPAPQPRPAAPSLPTGPGFGSRAPVGVTHSMPEVARPVAPPPAAHAAHPAVAAPVAAAFSGANGAEFEKKLGSLGLTAEQVNGVLSLSREVLERVAWEVVPTLAETIIREEIQRLTRE
jgi:CheY-like chemotaxis protein